MNIARGGTKGSNDPNEAAAPSGMLHGPQALPSWLRKTLTPGEWSAFEKALKVFDGQRAGVDQDETMRDLDVFARYWDLLSAFSIRANQTELDRALRLVNYDPSSTLSLNQSLELVSWLLYFERVATPSVGELCGSEIDPEVISKAVIDVEKLSQYLASFELDVGPMLPKAPPQPRRQPRFFEEERHTIQLKEFQSIFGLDDIADHAGATRHQGPPIYVPAVHSQTPLRRDGSGRDLRHIRIADAAGDPDLDGRLGSSKPKKIRPAKSKESSGQTLEDQSTRSVTPGKDREPQLHLIQCILDRMAEQSKGLPITRIMKQNAGKKIGLGVLDPKRNGNAKIRLLRRALCEEDVAELSEGSEELRSLEEERQARQRQRKRSPGLSSTYPSRSRTAPSWPSTRQPRADMEVYVTPLPYAEWYAQYYVDEALAMDGSPASAHSHRARKGGQSPAAPREEAGKWTPITPVTGASLLSESLQGTICPPIDEGRRQSASRGSRRSVTAAAPPSTPQKPSRALPAVSGKSRRLTSLQLEDSPLGRCRSPGSPTSPKSAPSPPSPTSPSSASPAPMDQLLRQVHQANRLLSSKAPLL
eukprot:EG_transcript_5282